MLTIWGRRNSFNVQKVMWLASELSLDYTHIEKGGSFGGLDAADFVAMNPHRKVPVIRDGDALVWESHAILRYLAASYGRRCLQLAAILETATATETCLKRAGD